MRIVVIGGTRFIGREIVRRAREAGHEVTTCHREAGEGEIAVDAAALSEQRDRLRALRPDVVVHCVCNDQRRADELVATFRGDDVLTIALSSADCYAAFQQLVRDQTDYDLPLDETSPTCATRHYWRGIGHHVDADYDKNLMTERLMAAHREGSSRPLVFRLPMVYGPHDYQLAHRHGPIVRRILDERRRFVVGAQEQSRLLSFGYVENVAAAIVHAFGRRDLDGEIFNLAEPQVRPWRRWAELYARAAGWQFDYAVVPDEILLVEPPARDALLGHMIVDGGRYRRQSGFVEVVDLETGIGRTLEFGRAHPELLGDRPDYEAEDRLVARARSIRGENPTI